MTTAPPEKSKTATQLDWESYRTTRYFPAVDGVRGIAILLVIFWHAGPYHLADRSNGYGGVDLFFVLSGFLITTLCLRESERSGQLNLRGFFVRRATRILPMYGLALACYIAVVAFVLTDERDRLFAALPKCLLFANEFAPPSILDHTWSLAVEEKFYVVWPLLAFWLLRHRPRTRTVIAAVLAGVPFVVRLLIQVGAAPQAWEFPHQSRWLYGGYSSILIGCLLAIALDNRETYERVVRALRFTIPILLAYVITLLTLRDWWLSLGLYPWVSGALVGAAAVSKARPLAWLRSRALRLCGALSYGLYLFHVLVVVWVEHALGFTTIERPWNFAPLLLCVAISFPVAYLLHRTIETPAVAFGRRIAGHPALAPAEADS